MKFDRKFAKWLLGKIWVEIAFVLWYSLLLGVSLHRHNWDAAGAWICAISWTIMAAYHRFFHRAYEDVHNNMKRATSSLHKMLLSSVLGDKNSKIDIKVIDADKKEFLN